MKVIEFQDGTFLAVDDTDTPLFEFTFHADTGRFEVHHQHRTAQPHGRYLCEIHNPSARDKGERMKRKPLALDLFSGAGGAAIGMKWAGFEVVGVDIKKPSCYYGDYFIQAECA